MNHSKPSYTLGNSLRWSWLCFFVLTTFCFQSFGQVVSKEQLAYSQALELYEKGVYASSRVEWGSFLEKYPSTSFESEAHYYRASSAVKMKNKDGQSLMIAFVNQHSDHPLAATAISDLVDFYYLSGDYIAIVDLVTQHDVSEYLQKDSGLYFKVSYAYYNTGDLPNALTGFTQVHGSGDEYRSDAAYYIGVIKKEQGEVIEATKYFEEAMSSDAYGTSAVKEYASLQLQSRNYTKVIEVLDGQDEAHSDPEILRILGEAHYAVKNYRMTVFNLGEFIENSKRRKDRSVYYKLGFSAYQVGDMEKAALYLKEAALSKDTLGAYSSYYLGLIYLNNENYPFATAAFRNVLKYDNALKEEALFLAGKTEFDQSNFRQSIPLFNDYGEQYPRGAHAVVVSEMLSESYLNTDNYEAALNYLEGLGNLTGIQQGYYQHIAFSKAIDLFNKRRFYESISFFNKAMRYRQDVEVATAANYWTGEAYTIGKKYDKALSFYRTAATNRSSVNGQKALYGLGYALYNLKRYSEALRELNNFVGRRSDLVEPRFYSDALLRIGDCHFVAKNYNGAVANYEQAIQEEVKSVVYAHYQIGLSWRYMDEVDDAEARFRQLLTDFPNSERSDDATFQIGQLNYENGNFEKAIAAFDNLIANYPDSRYVPFAILNASVSRNNLKQYSEATNGYKRIIEDYPRHSTANSALLGLQSVAGAGEFDQFDLYVEKYKKANPESTALENIEFESAKNLYYNQEYSKSIESLNKFVASYPESTALTEATYLIGDSWFRQEELQNALRKFMDIQNLHEFSKYLRVQYRIASIQQRLGEFSVSNNYFHRLLKGANNGKEKTNAALGLMENHFSLNNYDSAIYYAQALQNNTRISVDAESLSNLILGKSYYFLDKHQEAQDWLILLITDSPNVYGAEAKYYIAKIFYEQEDYTHSLQTLFELTGGYSTYELWVGRAFLLMADNYMATNEDFQATATLSSLVENSPIESIVEKARVKLKTIEEKAQMSDIDTTILKGNND